MFQDAATYNAPSDFKVGGEMTGGMRLDCGAGDGGGSAAGAVVRAEVSA